jgi:hypothetical protein
MPVETALETGKKRNQQCAVIAVAYFREFGKNNH